MPGFRFAETMSGTWTPADAPEARRRFSFTIEAVADSLARHLRQGGRTRIHGTVVADGLADRQPLEGTLTMAPLTRRIIRYEFDFTGDDGQPYRFEGQKDIRLTALRRSFTELPGVIRDAAGAEVGTATTQFDLGADWFQFLTSFRPV